MNFRNTASTTANDLEVNLGPISALAALNATEIVATASLVQGVYGAPSPSVPIGFSAAAADASGTTGTLWLTRGDSTPGAAPDVAPAQQVFSAQNLVAARIANIGTGANAGTILAQGEAIVTGGTSGDSYQAQGEQSTAVAGQSIINYAGDESIAASKGGNIESIQDGTGPVYEALWEVPKSGTPDTYLGFFTFNTDGEVDFTPASVVVSQPPASLTIVPNGPDSVSVLWPSAVAYTLQQNGNLAATGAWVTSSYAISTSNGTNSITVTPLTGNNLFFRLATP